VSFERLPDRVAGYATYELAQRLAALSPQQRAAIDLITQHVYIDNKPWAALFRGESRICSETNYYRRGRMDEATGRWLTRPGWGHDKEFQDALAEAVRLALQVQTREELTALQSAKRRARLAAPGVVDALVQVATLGEDKLRATAGKIVLDYGSTSSPAEQVGGDSAEDDWWKAAEDE
jgi:hypothetical protein